MTVKNVKIRKINKIKIPTYLIFFDTESNIHDADEKFEPHSFKLGVCIFIKLSPKCEVVSRNVLHFTDVNQFWKYVNLHTYKNSITYIFAHNIKYDLASADVINMLPKYGWKTNFPIMKHAFIMGASRYGRKITFLDTHNFVKTSVKRLGQSVGLKKLDIDFNTCTIQELFTYCERDVEIIERFILNLIIFLYENDLGSIKSTLASTAFDVFRKSFMNIPIYTHEDKDILALERKSYKGGRVECFFIGKTPKDRYFVLDVNSMYPFVMAEKLLPTKVELFIDEPVTVRELKNLMEQYYCIADVEVKNENHYGIYSLKSEEKRLLFPVGKFRVQLHHVELVRAIHDKSISKCFKVCCYTHDYVLRDYSYYFYKMKQNSDSGSVNYEMSKLLLNSLYGRFGMRKYITDYSSRDDFKGLIPEELKNTGTFTVDIDGKNTTFHVWYDTVVHSYSTELEPQKNTNIALAGAVTAYARLLLLEYIEIAGLENVFYCDTDSLFLNETGMKNLKDHLDDKRLGALKVEMKPNVLKILAPKNYKLIQKRNLTFRKNRLKYLYSPFYKSINKNVKVRSKGIPLGCELNEDGKFEFWRFGTWIDYLKRDGFIGRIKVIKQNTLQYKKGIIDNQTGKVYPPRFKIVKGENVEVTQ